MTKWVILLFTCQAVIFYRCLQYLRFDMHIRYRDLYLSRENWVNITLLVYPSLLTAFLASLSFWNEGFLLRIFVSVVFNLIFAGFTLLSIFSIKSTIFRTAFLKILYLWEFFYLFLSLIHFILYGQLIGLDVVYSVLNTDFHEANEFIQSNVKLKYLALALVSSFPLLYFAWKPVFYSISENDKNLKFRFLPPVALLITAIAPIYFGKHYLTDYNPIIHSIVSVTTVVSERNALNRLSSIPKRILTVSRDENQAVHILVVGESVNRNHMSLYGYERETTPNLDEISSDLYIVADACSSRNYTIAAFKEMLTFARRDNHDHLFDAPNLLQIMAAAGFQTYWISNQQAIENGGSFVSFLSESAKQRFFVNRRGWTEGVSLDQKIFEPLKKVLSEPDGRKFILIHLLGSHQAYGLRYPQEYRKFDNSETSVSPIRSAPSFPRYSRNPKQFNEYDNSILYGDYVLSQIIKMQDRNKDITVSYISDHGEAVGENGGFFGHGVNLPYRSMYEVPLLFWFSGPAQQRLRPQIDNLRKNLYARFQSDQLIDTLLDLYRLDYPLTTSTGSLFSTKFNERRRYCDNFKREREPLHNAVNIGSTSGTEHRKYANKN